NESTIHLRRQRVFKISLGKLAVMMPNVLCCLEEFIERIKPPALCVWFDAACNHFKQRGNAGCERKIVWREYLQPSLFRLLHSDFQRRYGTKIFEDCMQR